MTTTIMLGFNILFPLNKLKVPKKKEKSEGCASVLLHMYHNYKTKHCRIDENRNRMQDKRQI